MFSRVAIVNRGEAAMRLIHAVRDLAAETGAPIETVALHTDVDRTATFVREADLAYDLGPASARPYLDLKVLERALVETGADAAWVGWGFVAEDPAFAELCERIGVTFVGPSAEAMRKLGDKIGAKLIAEEVGVPVAPWSRGAVEDLDAAVRAAGEIGYPLMLKATAGGGGRGIRVVTDEAELADAYERTSQEAARAFGSGVVFLERLVTGARHVEVQVIADGQGTAWALGVRDCSVQRRNQKVIEESASPVLSAEQAAELKASAERLAVAVGYSRRGDRRVPLPPRRQAVRVPRGQHPPAGRAPDHRVHHRRSTWSRRQLHVASGGRLDGEPPAERGHAIEARLNAEDPDRDFAPSPGRIARLDLPAGPGIRVDTGVSEGDTIPADFDSMIAKIIAYGRDRDEALGRLRRAMAQTTVIIEGGATNKSFVLDLLDQPEVIDASADTGWIDRVRGEGRLVSHRHSAVALAAAAIEAYEEEERVERQRLLSTAFGGRPQVQHESGRPLDLKLRGAGYRVRVARVGAHRFRVGIEAGDAGAHRRRRAGPLRPAHRADRRQRHPVPPAHRHARADPPGRGGRRDAPGQPRRGRRRPLAGARAGRRHAAGGRRRGRGRRAGAGAGEHEDGDGAAGAVPGAAEGVRRVRRQPGGDRCAAAAAGAARRRGRRRADGARPPPRPSSWTCPPGRRDVPARERAARGPAGPAQPAARLRRRPARRAPGARRLPRRAPELAAADGSGRWPRRSS